MMEDFEKFYAKIRNSGNSQVITIPEKLMKYTDIKEGSGVEVYIKKID